MNFINRFIIILALIVVLVVVTVVVAAICLFDDFLIEQLVIFSGWLEGIEPRIMLQDRLLLIAIAVVVDLVLIFFLLLQFRRPEPKSVRIQRVEGGTALLTSGSIQKRLAFYIDGLSEVVNVRPRVRIKKDAVIVAADVQTSADVHLPSKAREIVAVIRMVVTETMGLELHGEPQVNIRTASYKSVRVPKAVEEKADVAEEIAPTQEAMAAKEIGPAQEAMEAEEFELVQEAVLAEETELPAEAAVEEE